MEEWGSSRIKEQCCLHKRFWHPSAGGIDLHFIHHLLPYSTAACCCRTRIDVFGFSWSPAITEAPTASAHASFCCHSLSFQYQVKHLKVGILLTGTLEQMSLFDT